MKSSFHLPRMLRGAPAIWGALGAGLIIALVSSGWGRSTPHGRTAIATPLFEADGSVQLPIQYRHWIDVGTRVKIGGRSILDGTKVTIPQVLNTYVEPSALDYYKRTGLWPDGAQIVKEITLVRTGKGCDKATFVCTTPIGGGFFQQSYVGLGMMIKDSKRFPMQPGNWAYVGFFYRGSGFDSTAKVRPQAQCAACHVKLASNTQYVFTQAHLGLQVGNIP